MTSERDISTERIRKAIGDIEDRQRSPHAEPEHCKQEARIEKLEETVEKHTVQLGEGAQQFIRLEMGLANVAEKVGELIGVLKWAAFGLASFVALLAGGAIIWAIVASGGKSAGITP